MSNAYVRFWGVRGSYASPFPSHLKVGGNTSCVEIRADDHILICDAGTGIIPLGNELIAQDEIRNLQIVLTHYHWDHICGLPFFVPAFLPEWNINMFGPGQSAEHIEKCISDQMKAPYFPVETENWMANITYRTPDKEGFSHGPIKATYTSVHHPGVTYGYRLEVNDKVVIYISDNECLYLEKSIAQRYDEFSEKERELLEKMEKEERDSELKFIQGADILIHDAQYTPDDYLKKRGWGHSCYIDTVNSAIDAEVKELYLYHHDPNYDDAAIDEIHRKAQEIIHTRKSSLICHIAREGTIVDL